MLPADRDGVVEVGVGLVPRLLEAPGGVGTAEEEALLPDATVRGDAGATVRRLSSV